MPVPWRILRQDPRYRTGIRARRSRKRVRMCDPKYSTPSPDVRVDGVPTWGHWLVLQSEWVYLVKLLLLDGC